MHLHVGRWISHQKLLIILLHLRPDSVGGGGWIVAKCFRDLHNRTTFAGGGGGQWQKFSVISIIGPRSLGGGGVVREYFSLAPRKDQSDFPQFRDIFDISHSKNVTTSIHCRKKHLQKVCPPWLRHCYYFVNNATLLNWLGWILMSSNHVGPTQ